MDPQKTIGVIGDVHCEDVSLSLAIETFRVQKIETIVCTGDVPTGLGDINTCCRLLHTNKIPTVRGNHDRWLLDFRLVNLPHATPPGIVSKSSWRFLESLPVTIDLQTPGGLGLLCHGLGSEDMISIPPEQSDSELDDHPILHDIVSSGRYELIINGHSHHRMVRRYGELLIVNAGTLRRDHNPCFAAIDFAQKQVTYWDILNQTSAVQSEVVNW